MVAGSKLPTKELPTVGFIVGIVAGSSAFLVLVFIVLRKMGFLSMKDTGDKGNVWNTKQTIVGSHY